MDYLIGSTEYADIDVGSTSRGVSRVGRLVTSVYPSVITFSRMVGVGNGMVFQYCR